MHNCCHGNYCLSFYEGMPCSRRDLGLFTAIDNNNRREELTLERETDCGETFKVQISPEDN